MRTIVLAIEIDTPEAFAIIAMALGIERAVAIRAGCRAETDAARDSEGDAAP
jgi:hypothetical protein